MVFLIKYSCACVGVNKLSDLTTCTVQIQSQIQSPLFIIIHFGYIYQIDLIGLYISSDLDKLCTALYE